MPDGLPPKVAVHHRVWNGSSVLPKTVNHTLKPHNLKSVATGSPKPDPRTWGVRPAAQTTDEVDDNVEVRTLRNLHKHEVVGTSTGYCFSIQLDGALPANFASLDSGLSPSCQGAIPIPSLSSFHLLRTEYAGRGIRESCSSTRMGSSLDDLLSIVASFSADRGNLG